MKKQTLRATLLAAALLPQGAAYAMPPAADADCIRTSDFSASNDGDAAGIRLGKFSEAMREQAIPGAQLIHARQGAYQAYCHGVMSNESGKEVTGKTVFQAASLSKVVAAYITLRFVDQGKIDLDTPLWNYWQSPRTRDNALAMKVTARMVLNHTTGLPNWQISPSNPAIDDTPLVNEFAPGERFQYSGEGFYLLQNTLEHLAGMRWEELAEREVFARFDMPSSSFHTLAAFDAFNSTGHEQDGTVRSARVFPKENTAWTLVTNAHDYNNFIQGGLYKGEGLKPSTHGMMLARSSNADDKSVPNPADPFIDWGLGVGIQSTEGRKLVWHWGDNPGFKAFFALDPATGESIVLFTNSENGPSTYKEVLELFMGEGEYPAVDWASAHS
ncbi:serine hydrolase domain-containing protein [Pseudoxanthomonas yeongjuensis]|uniref:serine hydrolase domain-containing protein n=1 Tax=Pseudoxanthomonas yeongjuensis TaxID=377616 RepID=UPI00139111DD|nr:serine hydrolase domain-containing protein [Pseudoxanthomonas yeongjuensis]